MPSAAPPIADHASQRFCSSPRRADATTPASCAVGAAHCTRKIDDFSLCKPNALLSFYTPGLPTTGDRNSTPADFEAMVADLKNSRAVPGSAQGSAVAGETARGQGFAPPPTRFEPRQWSRFTGAQGAGGNPPPRIFDWPGQQISGISGSRGAIP